MNFPEMSDVTPAKVADLRARIARLGIRLSDIEETFVRGSGKGGQKINKTANCVMLRYTNMDMVVRCQRERKRSINRFLALRELVDRVEFAVSPQTSRKLEEINAVRKKKGLPPMAASGGVNISEIDAATMASKKTNGLFITGELLDVDGITGGYNLHFAWASALSAGRAAAEGL